MGARRDRRRMAARFHPQRGRSVENRRSQARSSASSAVIGGGALAVRGSGSHNDLIWTTTTGSPQCHRHVSKPSQCKTLIHVTARLLGID